ncbi:demethylmenaquinone methyltransferase-like [Corticium candelabrum]|uniref:demethylmenaquinone methyltransferase-like n=1 Tax=Corticium candelabrum TaxID=121492 RepID=UPI002E268D86|nr:demethylmenaquinone methyltransferase-like [Corticium candelabrum]
MSTLPVLNNADMYHHYSDVQFRDGCSVIHEMLKPKRGESILDLGCGTGRLTMQLASLVGDSGRVVGVDPDSCRIAVANEQLKKMDDIPVTFQLGSIREALPLGPFDGIFSNYVFHWFERAERAEMMHQMYDSLKPGGRLTFVLETNQPQPNAIIRDIFRLTEPNLDEESASGMKMDVPSVWLQHCSDVGFVVELSEVFRTEKAGPNLDVILQFLKASIPNFQPIKLTDDGLHELDNRYKTGNGDQVAFSLTVLKVLARKPQES